MSEDTSSGLSENQRRALAQLLDVIVPPSESDGLPGAGELGLVAYIAQRAPELEPVIVKGLASLDALAADRGAAEFGGLSTAQRVEAVGELAAAEPGFLPGLIFHTYTGYYQNARVMEALGLPPRPPHPQGYELETGDLGLLDPVRDRPRLYREV